MRNRQRLRNQYRESFRRKQALRAFYGNLKEQSLRKYLGHANTSKKRTPEILIQKLECRVDTLLYRRG